MKKLAALLASVAVLWGSHAAAERVLTGEEAIELILEAHDEGLIFSQKEQYGGIIFRLLLNRRNYYCSIKNFNQFCEDVTGIAGKYEE